MNYNEVFEKFLNKLMVQKLSLVFIVLILTFSFEVNSTATTTPSLQSLSVSYIHDKNEELFINDVLALPFKSISNQSSLGINYDTVWYKIVISAPNQIKQLFLHDKLAYLSQQVDIYELTKSKQIIKNSYDLLDKNSANKLTGSTLVYPFSILPNETKTIYIKNKALAHQFLDLKIFNKRDSSQALINKNFFSNVILGCLFALALYNAMIFFFNKKKEFVIYALYLLNVTIGLSYLYGMVFHNLNNYGEHTYWLNLTAILVSVFLALFVQTVFETHKTCRKIHQGFNIVILIAVIDFMIAMFISLPLAIHLVGIVFICSFSVICYMAVYYYKKKHPLIKIFITAYSFYVIGIVIVLSTFMGYIPFNFFTFHASGIGILIEAVLFSYLLNFHMVLLENKVSLLVAAQNNLKFIASHDHLTGTLNRREFMEQSEAAVSLAKRHNETLSVMMIDLDLFKKVNDTYGHHTGDAVLTIFSETVKSVIRTEDIIGRIGGEEFCLILPKLTKEKSFLVAEKIRKAIEAKRINSNNYQIKQTISIGLSTLTNKDKSHFEIQKRADKALYEAKNKGRNRVIFK